MEPSLLEQVVIVGLIQGSVLELDTGKFPDKKEILVPVLHGLAARGLGTIETTEKGQVYKATFVLSLMCNQEGGEHIAIATDYTMPIGVVALS